MREEELHIDVLFTHMQPEFLRNSMLKSNKSCYKDSEKSSLSVSSCEISEEGYLHCARSAFTRRTIDELIQFYRELDQFMKKSPENNVFVLLADYAGKVLHFRSGKPFFRQEKAMGWRMKSLALGQDLFTCAGLAWKDIQESCLSNNFIWPSVLQTDCIELHNLLERGISENHFHLNGSTQLFPLAWGFLMNHPECAVRYFKAPLFTENLKASVNWGVKDNKLAWPERIYDAAWIRAYLFRKCVLKISAVDENTNENQGNEEKCNFQSFSYFSNCLDKRKRVQEEIEILRFAYGARFQQPNGREKCLDYAITPRIADMNKGANRFLAGERHFLYCCFRYCFQRKLLKQEQDLLYLYLLIKLRFREELVQNNQRTGFRNFSDYQDRKSHGWGEMDEYWTESYRLSVRSTLEDSVISLEMRVMPEENQYLLKESVKKMDDDIDFGMDSWCKEDCTGTAFEWKRGRKTERRKDVPYFYVLHFGKKQLVPICRDSQLFFLKPRNWAVRKKVIRQAKAISLALEDNDYLCSRIRGIDACSHEIECRPEIFAAPFRFLTYFSVQKKHAYDNKRHWPLLGKTYHVGEDFLELTDGLRAIDEAICFLNLQSGDRIGHALALGISPEKYYDKNRRFVILPIQDILDNLVWILYRSMEWEISIPEGLRFRLCDYAETLLRKIYGKSCPSATLREYFESWTLRGDDPEIYSDLEFDDPQMINKLNLKIKKYQLHYIQYNRYMINRFYWKNLSPDNYREKENVLRLLYCYHHGVEERIKGAEMERFFIDQMYIQLLRKMQDCMMEKIMEKGIAIECNPSSNYLIGSIERYDQHPIFRFNLYGLKLPEFKETATQLKVSVNTDDQGVFDTSLNNEYALLYACLQRRKSEEGKRLVSDDEVKEYLNHIRIMGNDMTFPKSEIVAARRVVDKETS